MTETDDTTDKKKNSKPLMELTCLPMGDHLFFAPFPPENDKNLVIMILRALNLILQTNKES